jgi:hypothetical protein
MKKKKKKKKKKYTGKSAWKAEAIKMAKTAEFHGKPLSIAVRLNVMNGTIGFDEYGD